MGGEYIDYTWEEVQATSEHKAWLERSEEIERNKQNGEISESTKTFSLCCSCEIDICSKKQKCK